MRFEDDIDDAELLELMDAPTVPRSAGDGSRGTNATPAAEAPAVATAAPAVDPALATSLTATLKKFFGHDAFRAGQLDVVAAAVSGRDCAVYWSTGSGKSMCYQVPALHTGKTTLVVSPLVSLMQDQVTHLNNTAGEGQRELAAFLGSAQTDASVQERALRGEFAVLYVTPEKLVGFVDDDGKPPVTRSENTEPTYFVRRLREMVETKTLGLVAVDEAHCLSQWGHDFRAAYRALDALRAHLAPNGEVPLMALTATAVGAVRADIADVLSLRDPFVAVNSCDRPNLRVRVCKKRGAETDFKAMADAARAARGSVIVYCPSVRETEAVCEALRAKFAAERGSSEMRVGAYHARLSPAARKQTHMDFLVGACDVVAATVAFGMGIDKPDIRLVVHYGAPKTMEEYYQQVGRAGRDGLPSECLMLYGDNDFVKYASDFYVGKLSREARETQKKSTDALERFARDARGCRRAGILRHFGETTPDTWRPAPAVGDATSAATSDKPVSRRVCGTCDACSRLFESAASGRALEAEYTLECAPVLMAVARGFPGFGASMTHVVALATDSNPPANGRAPAAGVRERVRAARLALAPTTRSQAFVKEITRALADNGFLRAVAVKSEYGSYEVFRAMPQGVAVANAAFEVFASDCFASAQKPTDAAARREAALAALARRAPGARVILPVPESLARAEADAKAAADAKVLELEAAGADTSAIPAAELEAGAGPALNAELQWARTIAKLRQSGDDAKSARADAMAELLRRVERWRDSTAEKLGMAPGSVFASFVAKRVAYTCASGGHLDVESLRSAGVRVAGAEGLAAELKSAAAELGLARETVGGVGEARTDASDKRMRLASFAPVKPWPFALYKPRKKKGCPDEPPPWETSWRRFAGGEAPAAIALTQPSGRAVQVTTVVGHLLEALTQGRTVDFKRLGSFEGLADRFPTEREWRSMDDAADRTAQDPAGDPASFSQRELLRSDALLGAEAVDVDRELKSEMQRAAEASWYDKIRVYVALRRAGVEPEWDDADEAAPDAKRARTNHR